LELLDSAAKESHHLILNLRTSNISMEQKTLYRKWEGKETSFQKELVENYFLNGGKHFQSEDVLW
jgi:hypothetical protein